MNVGRDSRRTKSSARTSKQSRVCLTLLWNSTQLAQERMRRGRSNVPSTRLPLYLALSRRFVLECDDGHHNPAGTPNK